MSITIGEVIRRRIRDDKRSAQEICDALGMSRGNLDKIYKKTSVNTDFLARLSTLLNFDFFDYVNPFKLAGEESKPALPAVYEGSTEYNTPLTRIQKCLGELYDAKKEIDILEKEVVMLRANLIDKDLIISLLKDKTAYWEKKARGSQTPPADPS
jgi:hypothetical protein